MRTAQNDKCFFFAFCRREIPGVRVASCRAVRQHLRAVCCPQPGGATHGVAKNPPWSVRETIKNALWDIKRAPTAGGTPGTGGTADGQVRRGHEEERGRAQQPPGPGSFVLTRPRPKM